MKLLELLFDNVFVLIFLFGVISYLLQKIRGTGAPAKQERKDRVPTFGGDPHEEEEPFELPRGRQGSYSPQAAQAPAYVWEETREPELLNGASLPSSKSASSIPPTLAKRPALQQPSLRLHPDNAVQGMIWSEVYGPPRSVKPHITRRR